MIFEQPEKNPLKKQGFEMMRVLGHKLLQIEEAQIELRFFHYWCVEIAESVFADVL